MRPSIFKRSLVQKQSHRQCLMNASQHSHTFDAQMVCVNFLVLPPALPLLLSAIISLTISRSSSLMSHIPPSSHHLACHSTDFSHSSSSEAHRLATLNFINEAFARLGGKHHGWVNVSWKLDVMKTVRSLCKLVFFVEKEKKPPPQKKVQKKKKSQWWSWLTECWTEARLLRSCVGFRITSNQRDSDAKSDWVNISEFYHDLPLTDKKYYTTQHKWLQSCFFHRAEKNENLNQYWFQWFHGWIK